MPEEQQDENQIEPDNIPNPEEPEETPPQILEEKPEENCDPLVMNCDEMRDYILADNKRANELEKGMSNLEELIHVFPLSKEVKTLYNQAREERKQIDERIYNTFSRFSVCSRKPPEKTE